ncbi:GNAT family N-acetyltransferase [uncultured Acinetobacter sp.]|uniref:GNAT family N-acetyltransferase n=1 Tax=uncultured Acinetobacter sp. TaxID=165433 RepID=UPI0025F116C7|nr:GNAT family N-acetyltransferase [uncultured Acinetobacter sp.]
MNHFKFRLAQQTDIPKLVALINAAYRRQEGRSWTSEAEIVAGQRVSTSQLAQSLSQANFQLWLAMHDEEYKKEEQIVACIGLTINEHDVEIGTFCIAPQVQNQGIGKQVLDFAERYIRQLDSNEHQHLNAFVMWVLSVRTELIAYYERRGYVRTGVIEDYPLDADVGIPMMDLHLVEMRKGIHR